MRKSEDQVLNFLKYSTFKSQLEFKAISSFCKTELKMMLDDPKKFNPKGVSCSEFLEWYENGLGAGDVVVFDDKLGMIGSCSVREAKMAGKLVDGKLDVFIFTLPVSNLKLASPEQAREFHQAIASIDCFFNPLAGMIAERRFPRELERVRFFNHEIHGLGVVRSVDKKNNSFELYCSYVQETNEIKYSMQVHFDNLRSFTFIEMTTNDRRRLEWRLNSCGKSWNERLHRVEPKDFKLKKGDRYWYIDDKMKVVSGIEKDLQTTKKRRSAGNYFSNLADAIEVLGEINLILRNHLAK